MAIIPFPDDRVLVRLYECARCGSAFLGLRPLWDQPITTPRPRCAVNHAPGTCCHYGERLVPREAVREVLAMLDRESQPAPPEDDS